MEREAFRQRMQQYKQAKEQNPQLKYWDWKKYADGGTVGEDGGPERPIINFNPKGDPYKPVYGYNPGAGYTSSVLDLYDAPIIGDVLSIYDASKAAYNKDWVGAGLAALSVLPFVPNSASRAIKKTTSKYIPEVVRTSESKINALLRQQNKIKQLGEEVPNVGLRKVPYEKAMEARDRVYESVIDPENLRRARAIDKRYGTSYEEIYKGMDIDYQDPLKYFTQSYEPVMDVDLPSSRRAEVNVNPRDNRIRINKEVNTGEFDINTGLIRHEIGHKVDAAATNGAMTEHPFMRDLVKDIIPYDEAKYMLHNIEDAESKYRYLTRPSEVKSHMNQFRQYLIDQKIMKPSDKVEDVPNFFMHLQAAPDEFNGLKLLQNLFKSDKAFKKRFDQIPLTTIQDNKVRV